jgi:polyadenylate-binding protein
VKQSRRPFNNIYVKNFSEDPDFKDEQLAELFKQYGDIQNACVMRDGEGRSKGFGFVCFYDPASAEKATEDNKLEHEKVGDGAPKLYCCEAKTK